VTHSSQNWYTDIDISLSGFRINCMVRWANRCRRRHNFDNQDSRYTL